MVSTNAALKPVRAMGGFSAMMLDEFVLLPRRPFAWREFLLQSWFVARVSLVPTLLLTIPQSHISDFRSFATIYSGGRRLVQTQRRMHVDH